MVVERKAAAAEKRRTGKRKTTITIVGAGRMGTALARALALCGYEIAAMVARRKSHALEAAELTNARPLALTQNQLDELPPSDIIFITTPDDVIESTAAKLAATLAFRTNQRKHSGKEKRRAIALHTSGALSSVALKSLGSAGFSTGSMHPLVSVSDAQHGAESLRSAFFCIEGDGAAVRVARQMVRALGAESFSIAAKDKALYHAAAVMASGHMTALIDIAIEMLSACGLSKRRARAILLPLIKSALENLSASDPARALTGTFARADLATVRRHLDALDSHKMVDALKAYVLLGQRSLRLAKTAGAPSDALQQIARALALKAGEAKLKSN